LKAGELPLGSERKQRREERRNLGGQYAKASIELGREKKMGISRRDQGAPEKGGRFGSKSVVPVSRKVSEKGMGLWCNCGGGVG